jgi:hypothetical protein
VSGEAEFAQRLHCPDALPVDVHGKARSQAQTLNGKVIRPAQRSAVTNERVLCWATRLLSHSARARGPYKGRGALVAASAGGVRASLFDRPALKLAQPAVVRLDLADLAGISQQLESLPFAELDGSRGLEVFDEAGIDKLVSIGPHLFD